MRSLYLITDAKLCGGIAELPAALERALTVLPPGRALVQLREKSLHGGALLALARTLLPICRARDAKLLVNDRLDVALAAGADGIHLSTPSVEVEDARALASSLGRDDFLVGASCHNFEELRLRKDADFVVCSPVFASPGKGPPLGLEGLRELARRAEPEVFALGGVEPRHAAICLQAGARGLAAIRAWLGGDPAASAAALHEALRAAESTAATPSRG